MFIEHIMVPHYQPNLAAVWSRLHFFVASNAVFFYSGELFFLKFVVLKLPGLILHVFTLTLHTRDVMRWILQHQVNNKILKMQNC